MRQYAASPTIQQLIADRKTYFPAAWQDQFYDVIWNPQTAQGFGLDIWGRIVVIGRDIQIPVVDYFGFATPASLVFTPKEQESSLFLDFTRELYGVQSVAEANAPQPPQSWNPFGQESFYTGPAATTTFTLADNAYRVLVRAKALANISSTDSRSMNKFLAQLFPGRGRAWVNDLGSMSMRFYFEFALEPWEMAVLTNGGVLPRPAGVNATIAQIPADSFGFSEAGVDSEPFNQGTFINNGAVTNVA